MARSALGIARGNFTHGNKLLGNAMSLKFSTSLDSSSVAVVREKSWKHSRIRYKLEITFFSDSSTVFVLNFPYCEFAFSPVLTELVDLYIINLSHQCASIFYSPVWFIIAIRAERMAECLRLSRSQLSVVLQGVIVQYQKSLRSSMQSRHKSAYEESSSLHSGSIVIIPAACSIT